MEVRLMSFNLGTLWDRGVNLMKNVIILSANPTPNTLILSSLAEVGVDKHHIKPLNKLDDLFDLLPTYTAHLIISEFNFDDPDDIETCQSLKADFKTHHLPLLVFGQEGHMQDFRKAFEAGADYYVPNDTHAAKTLTRLITEILQDKPDNWLDKTPPPLRVSA